MEKIYLNLGNCKCNIIIGKNNLIDLKNTINENKCFFVVDRLIYEQFYNNYFINILDDINFEDVYLIDSNEANKNLNTVIKVIDKLNFKNHLRDSILVGIGGGIVGDIVGFVSSIYMRGIKFINIPTTLLSQIDSSIGGKNALNTPDCKNLIGTFNHPEKIIIDTKFLNTLPKRELISGLAEVIKYGIVFDYDFLVYIEKNLGSILVLDEDIIEKIIFKSCKFKTDIIIKDEYDFSLRRILNYGHTIGHAIESLTNYNTYTHGEAILIGMFYEACISYELGLIDKEYFNYISYILKKFKINFDKSIFENELFYVTLLRDKKNKFGTISFILPIGYSKVLEYKISLNEIKNMKFSRYCF